MLLALAAGHTDRGVAPAQEHLREFPLDVLVAHHALTGDARPELVRQLSRAWYRWSHDPQIAALAHRHQIDL